MLSSRYLLPKTFLILLIFLLLSAIVSAGVIHTQDAIRTHHEIDVAGILSIEQMDYEPIRLEQSGLANFSFDFSDANRALNNPLTEIWESSSDSIVEISISGDGSVSYYSFSDLTVMGQYGKYQDHLYVFDKDKPGVYRWDRHDLNWKLISAAFIFPEGILYDFFVFDENVYVYTLHYESHDPKSNNYKNPTTKVWKLKDIPEHVDEFSGTVVETKLVSGSIQLVINEMVGSNSSPWLSIKKLGGIFPKVDSWQNYAVKSLFSKGFLIRSKAIENEDEIGDFREWKIVNLETGFAQMSFFPDNIEIKKISRDLGTFTLLAESKEHYILYQFQSGLWNTISVLDKTGINLPDSSSLVFAYNDGFVISYREFGDTVFEAITEKGQSKIFSYMESSDSEDNIYWSGVDSDGDDEIVLGLKSHDYASVIKLSLNDKNSLNLHGSLSEYVDYEVKYESQNNTSSDFSSQGGIGAMHFFGSLLMALFLVFRRRV